MAENILQRELEKVRFERALEITESLAQHRALLTTAELARMNQVLLGQKQDSEPWRVKSVTLELKSGRSETLSSPLAMIENPQHVLRQKLHHATELAESGNIVDAALEIYVATVLSHPFLDANRRTAVLAAHYFLKRYGVEINGVALHEIGAGDLRDDQQVDALREMIQHMARFAAKRTESRTE